MTPSRPSVLVVLAGVAALAGFFGLRVGYGALPPLPVTAVLTLGLLAGYVGATAWTTRNRLARRPGTRALDPLAAARVAVLGKAAATVGAMTTGLWGGGTVWLLTQRGVIEAARRDTVVAALGVLAAVAVLLAGLAVERVCRLPEDD